MNKKLSGILGIILSIIVLIYFETFIYKVLGLIGINVLNYSILIRTIINLIIKLSMCFIIYLIYKKDFRHSRSSENIFKMVTFLIVGVVALTIVMYLFNYVVKFLCNIFNVNMISRDFYNIFDKKLDFYLIVKIINDYIITPYLYSSTIILSMDKLTKRNDIFILFSGLLASIIYGLSLSGTLLFVILNSLSMFLLFGILAFIYRKNNSIWFIIVLYGLYLISDVIILNYLGL